MFISFLPIQLLEVIWFDIATEGAFPPMGVSASRSDVPALMITHVEHKSPMRTVREFISHLRTARRINLGDSDRLVYTVSGNLPTATLDHSFFVNLQPGYTNPADELISMESSYARSCASAGKFRAFAKRVRRAWPANNSKSRNGSPVS